MKKFFALIIFFFFFCIEIYGIENISINNQELIPRFNKNTKVYNVFVDECVEIITINVVPGENETITGSGSKSLKKGLNIFEIYSYIEDNRVNSYVLNITRGDVEYDKQESRLENLVIENVSFNFKSDVYTYEINVKDDLEKINIEYVPKNPNSYIKVTGNKFLSNKENIIKIKLISEDKKNSSVYTIKLNKKELKDFKSNKGSVFDNKKFSSFELKLIRIGLISLGTLILGVIFYFIFIRKRTN